MGEAQISSKMRTEPRLLTSYPGLPVGPQPDITKSCRAGCVDNGEEKGLWHGGRPEQRGDRGPGRPVPETVITTATSFSGPTLCQALRPTFDIYSS